MATVVNRAAPVYLRCLAALAGLLVCLLANTAGALAAEPDELDDPTLAAMVPRARQLQRYGDLRTAEYIAEFDVKHHRTQSELAGGLEVVTTIYRQSGRLAEALATAQKYQQVLEAIPGAAASKRQDSQLLWAEILAGLNKYPEAISHVDDALAIPEGWRTNDVLWEPHALAVRARIEQQAGQSEPAARDWHDVETRVRRALDRLSNVGTDVDLEEAALKLATEALVATDRTAEAITLRRQFVARQLDDLVRQRNLAEIARLCGLLQDDAQQERALTEALALGRSDAGDRSQALRADLLDRLGLALQHQGRPAAARHRWEEALAVYQPLIERQVGNRRRWEQQLVYLERLQLVLQRLDRWPAASQAGEKLLKRRERNWPSEDPRLWRLKGDLARVYAHAGETAKARALLNPTLEFWRRRVPQAPTETAQTLIELSRVARQEKDLKRARGYAQDAVEVWQPVPTGHELQRAEADHNLADTLAAAHQYRSAVEQYRQAIGRCRDLPPDRRSTQLLCELLVDVAQVYKSQQHYQQAAEYCSQALAVRQQAPGKDPLALVGLHTALAALELAQRPDENVASDGQSPLEDQSLLDRAAQNIAAARSLCHDEGWLEGAPGIGVLELEAVVDVRRDQPEAARKSLDRALALSRRQHLGDLETRIRTQLAQLDRHARRSGENGSGTALSSANLFDWPV